MIAVLKIRREPHYRRDAFEQGLLRAGFDVTTATPPPRSPKDWLVIWNRQGAQEKEADAWERAGGTVIVCENGYIGKDAHGQQLYAIAVGGHNGSGWWPIGDEDRFSKLGIELRPFRSVYFSGPFGHWVIAQRGIGSKLMKSPPRWAENKVAKLKQRGILASIRPHPGNFKPKTSLEADLEGALGCHIWSSAAGVRALTLGIPVSFAAPHWICEGWHQHGGRRERVLHRMAHAQWTITEITSGEPFKRILEQRCR